MAVIFISCFPISPPNMSAISVIGMVPYTPPNLHHSFCPAVTLKGQFSDLHISMLCSLKMAPLALTWSDLERSKSRSIIFRRAVTWKRL